MPDEAKLSIRNASLKDLDVIQEIENASFGIYDEPFPRSVFLGFFEKNPGGFRVAEKDSQAVGYCYTSPPERKLLSKSLKATIFSLAVAPYSRHLGIGSMLLKDAVELLHGGQVELELQVAVRNVVAQELYKRFGFEVSRIRHDYYGIGKDAYEMKLEVK